MSIESISYLPLRDAIIKMQNTYQHRYYGHFALYFNYFEDKQMPSCGGVRINKRRFEFFYNSELLEKQVKKDGSSFLEFFVIHEIQHILLNHVNRTGDRNIQIANIAQDMLINTIIKNEYKYDFEDFYYVDKKYDILKWDPSKYKNPLVFEFVYDALLAQNDGVEIQACNIKLVDKHFEENNLDESESSIIDVLVRDINENLKARGFDPGSVEKVLNFKREKSIVNIFKRVFSSGLLKERTYKRLSRRVKELKGKKKENKDINLILDTSGSLYDELDKYIGNIIGKFSIYLVQIDTEVKFHKHIHSISEWKKIKKIGSGGTILQPSIDFLVKNRRANYPTYLVSDFYCDELDFLQIKSNVVLVKTKDAVLPKIKNCKKVKIYESHK